MEKECPKWLYEKINNPALVESLNDKAPADIRANFISREDAKNKLQITLQRIINEGSGGLICILL